MGAHRSSPFASEARTVLDCLRRIVQALRHFDREAEKRVRLSGAQVFVLQQLRDGKAITINELADRTHTHQSSVSVVAQRLADRGLVQRSRPASDARKVEISITPSGRRLLRSSPPAAQERLIESLRSFPARRRRRLAQDLSSLVDSMGIPVQLPPLFFEDLTKKKKS